MDRRQSEEFFQKWLSHYPYSRLDDLRMEEIYGKLKDYSAIDINRKFDEHLKNAQYAANEPKPDFLIKFLKKENDCKNIHDIKVRCKYCVDAIALNEYSNHIARHNSIYYIKKNEHLTTKTFNESVMMKMSQLEFDKLYDVFLDNIKNLIEKNQERKLVNDIVNHNSNIAVQEFLKL